MPLAFIPFSGGIQGLLFNYNPFIHQFLYAALIDICYIYKQKDLNKEKLHYKLITSIKSARFR